MSKPHPRTPAALRPLAAPLALLLALGGPAAFAPEEEREAPQLGSGGGAPALRVPCPAPPSG